MDFIRGLGKARADSLSRAYELDGQPLTQEIIAGIMTEVAGVLEQSAQSLFGAERGQIELLARRTNSTDPAASAKLSELSRHLSRNVHDTAEAIRNHLTLAMFEAKKNHWPGSATMKARELASSIKTFHDDLESHFDIWQQSLEPPLPDYPVRNTAELKEQTKSLARQLGKLRPYIETLTQSTRMHIGGQVWDVYDSAVSNDVAARKGPSIEAILPQLQQIIGKLESMNPETDISQAPAVQNERPQTVNIYNLHGSHSRVNIQSEDRSVNVSSITEQQVFSGIRKAVDDGVPDSSEKAMIMEKLDALEKSVHSPDFLSRYQAFINAVASHMTIILPFIPALTQMLGR
jgi:hypothetical protein